MGSPAYSAAIFSAETVEHYTPPEIVEAARLTLGAIDLDPASCAKANTIVRAEGYCDHGGLDREWTTHDGEPSRVFLNPPGGKLHRKTFEPLASDGGPGLSSAAVWWWKLLDEYWAGRVEQAIFLCFTLNVFQNSQDYDYPPPYAFPFCVPSSRLRFWNERQPIGKGQPQHCNAIVYLPPETGPVAPALSRFAQAFAAFGQVRL